MDQGTLDYLTSIGITPWENLPMDDDEWVDFDDSCEIEDFDDELAGSELAGPEYQCDHLDCHGPWSDTDRIMHHSCSLLEVYDCDTCCDHYIEGIIPCKRVNKVSLDIAYKRLVWYYRELNDNGLIHDIEERANLFIHKSRFNRYVKEELIAAAMHPNRIQKQLDQFDNIEDFFEAIGC